MRLAVVTNILSPYRIPLFEAMAVQCDDFCVFLMASTEKNRMWSIKSVPFKTITLPGVHLQVPWRESEIHLSYGVHRELRKFSPTVVLSGGFTIANISAALFCHRERIDYVGWGEVTLRDPSSKSLIRQVTRQGLGRLTKACIGSSSEAVEAFHNYGIPKSRALLSLMPIDVDYYRECAARFRSSGSYAQRKAKYPGFLMLSVGQLIPRKGCVEILKAFRLLQCSGVNASLIFLGGGELSAELQHIVKRDSIANVFFEGFKPASELCEYYAMANLFVFHTLFDTFGAVLAEAMACGTVCLASIHASATRDLIVEGIGGFTYDPKDLNDTLIKLRHAITLSESERLHIIYQANDSVSRLAYRESARQMVDFLKTLG